MKIHFLDWTPLMEHGVSYLIGYTDMDLFMGYDLSLTLCWLIQDMKLKSELEDRQLKTHVAYKINYGNTD